MTETKLYSGEVMDDFIVALAAIGYHPDMIVAAFKERYGRSDVTVQFVNDRLALHPEDVEAERKRQLDALGELNLSFRLEKCISKIEGVAERADQEGSRDARLLISAVDQARKLYELQAKLLGQLQESKKLEVQVNVNADVSWKVFQQLASRGLIEVKDKPGLLKMLGVVDVTPEAAP